MAESVTIKIDMRGLKKFKGLVTSGLRSHTDPYGAMFTQWAAIYAAFTRRRFNVYSRGGGDWRPLARSTALARARRADAARGRGGQGGGSGGGIGARSSLFRQTRGRNAGRLAPIMGKGGARTLSTLRDKGILFNAISIGAAGNYVGRVPSGVVYGFGRVKHGKARATIQQIAHWHNTGSGHNPRRVILATPDDKTKRQMMSAVRAATQKAIAAAAMAQRGAS